MTTPRKYDVLAIGNAIVDVLARAPDTFLTQQGLVKGSMRLVDAEVAEALYAEMGPGTEVSGGSAANTAVGVASLGGRAAFVGKVRDDQLGEVYTHDLRAAGVDFEVPAAPAGSGEPTGRSLILVSPDGERTMNTNLGVAVDVRVDDVPADLVLDSAVVYAEGYLWDSPTAKEAILHAAATTEGTETLFAFTLSDGFCVERHRGEFADLVESQVDVLFANEHEICQLLGAEVVDEAIQALRASDLLAFVTRSEHGSVVVHGDEVHIVEATPVSRVVDTTGAGDLYAAGALFGLTQGFDLLTCARLGSLAAAEVVSHIGARPLVDLRTLAEEAALL